MSDEFLSVPEIARRLQVSPRTVRRWIKAHRIPFCRCGPRLLRVSWPRLLAVFEGDRTAVSVRTATPHKAGPGTVGES